MNRLNTVLISFLLAVIVPGGFIMLFGYWVNWYRKRRVEGMVNE